MNERVLFTGSAGFLGRALWTAFAGDYTIRLCDVTDFEAGPHEKYVGDVADPHFCARVVKDCDMVVVAHMFPRPNHTPLGAFHANVTGTALLLHAAHHAGVRRCCLVSSVSAVNGHPQDVPRTPDLPLMGRDVYSATKACQEVVARSVFVEHALPCAVLRIGYVVDLEQMTDKYDTPLAGPKPGMIDRHECSVVCRKALEKPDLSYEVFYVYSFCDEEHRPEGLASYAALGWTPERALAGVRP